MTVSAEQGERSDDRLSARIGSAVSELPRLRNMLRDWLTDVGVEGAAREGLVLAAHEVAAQAIERGASEIAVQADGQRGAVRVSIAGGDWSSLDDLRLQIIRAHTTDVRVHHGVVGLRLNL
jgi:hypothetical protein